MPISSYKCLVHDISKIISKLVQGMGPKFDMKDTIPSRRSSIISNCWSNQHQSKLPKPKFHIDNDNRTHMEPPPVAMDWYRKTS